MAETVNYRQPDGEHDCSIRLGISTCLLGEQVRYDGGHKLDRFLVQTLGRYVEWVPVCPEVEIGLPIPRETMRLVGDPEAPRLVAIKSGEDYTDRMQIWAQERLDELAKVNLHGFVFKKDSPHLLPDPLEAEARGTEAQLLHWALASNSKRGYNV